MNDITLNILQNNVEEKIVKREINENKENHMNDKDDFISNLKAK